MRIISVALLAIISQLLALEATEILERTKEKYGNMNSFYAEFEQVYCDEEAGICQRFEGKTYYMKPNFFRMEITQPNQVYVGDSVSLWIYMPDEKRAVRQKLEQIPFQISPDAIFANYEEEYEPSIAKEDEEYYEILLTPKEESGMYRRITVQIRKNKFDIMAISIIDGAGTESKFEFTKMEINKKISKKIFKFNPPEGVQVDEY
ncbi:MAG: outer membrane lipoprotein chaperone LolA [candidate division WOR-3 bacterium]|nr:MAG: outer membrane lipoprotein chaperone LolA [candidate division WOR-3 bacterium]